MNSNLYSNTEFTKLVQELNKEIKRRGTYKWWDPLYEPQVGIDRSPPLSIPHDGSEIYVTEKTYTINTPSEGAMIETRNMLYPAQGDNPAGEKPSWTSPSTSASQLNVDEIRNLLIGLAKINDINLFYGKNEVQYTAFRDPKFIQEAFDKAKADKLHVPMDESDASPTRINDLGQSVIFPMENGKYVMPSGQYDGEEILSEIGLGPSNFYDDYGAQPGDSDYHPTNPYVSTFTVLDQKLTDDYRNPIVSQTINGGKTSVRFGPNPRNPKKGDEYESRSVFGGKKGSCNSQCTGLCYVTCDDQCSESCVSTCWNQCGNACTASCSQICTGCTTQCYTSCKTKCENSNGYSCVKSGLKASKYELDHNDGRISYSDRTTYFTCQGCQYSCQFYPNKKTECWDSGCMGECYSGCMSGCMSSCFGGCIDNAPEPGNSYKTGKGAGCSSNCTMNCIGTCTGNCSYYCMYTCFMACQTQCRDNCEWTCHANCGSGCFNKCTNGCTGCAYTCQDFCKGNVNNMMCVGCSAGIGCTSACQFDCNTNCIGFGCRSICGIDSAGACENNCRLNCSGASCTSMCADACVSACTNCVGQCDMNCGACTAACSMTCTSDCNMICTQTCSHSCDNNCVHSCTEECGGCSNLCYSCVGLCIGICSVKCTNNCSTGCTFNCSGWCDKTCRQQCLSTCDTFCLSTCSGSCVGGLTSDTNLTAGPDRDPTAEGYIYPHPENRWQERESFKLFHELEPYKKPEKEDPLANKIIIVYFDENKNLAVKCPPELKYRFYSSSIIAGVWNLYVEDGHVEGVEAMYPGVIEETLPNADGNNSIFLALLYTTYDEENQYTSDPAIYEVHDEDIGTILPFGFTSFIVHDDKGNTIVAIEKIQYSEELPDE